MNTETQSPNYGSSRRSRLNGKTRREVAKRAAHQALAVFGPVGFVKVFRTSNPAAQLKAVRHAQHLHVERWGLWWCQNEMAVRHLKSEVDRLLRETYRPALHGFYEVPLPGETLDRLVKLAAGNTGVVIFTDAEREAWLDDATEEAMARKFKGWG